MMKKGAFAQNKSDGDEITLGIELCWVGNLVVETAAVKGAGLAGG